MTAGVWRVSGAPLVAATAAGPLSGHTVAVKDLYAVAGFALGAGVPEFLGAPEERHAAVVSALLAAGADITGIAHTDEFAYSITGVNGRYGMPVNPAAPQRIPGGSSSGSAVAVSSGAVTIGLGTDTAGSIRVPAAYQGLWGIRTTHSSLSADGVVPLAPSFDAVGWLTRDARTLFAVADCLLPQPIRRGTAPGSNGELRRSGPSSPASGGRPPAESAPTEIEPDYLSELGPLSAPTDTEPDYLSGLGPLPADELVVDPALCDVADPELADRAVRVAAAAGARRIHIGADLDTWFAAFRTVQAHEAWAAHGPWIGEHRNALEPEVAQRFAYAATITGAAAAQERAVLAAATEVLRTALSGRALLLPATATLPPLRTAAPADLEAGRMRTLQLTGLASLAGLPAVAFPVAPVDGIPVGLCVIGAPHTDRDLIRVAAGIADRSAERVCV
ncbi:amidase family protein [Nocardia stercoris]|uniref:Glutamyl-tRNA amidotransferase n=1 Tax=Nocardia stercoris TaxID=2483361 RepID=A0A3M2KWD3_9NOCA|nr:amidase family protein [Nocardia stercoris]RMI29907.1 glutamyl-tRNA amidotransferase [Nocardia stercoris]